MKDKIFDMDVCCYEPNINRREDCYNVISFVCVPEKLVFALQKALFTYAKNINFIHVREVKERKPEQ